MKTITTALVVLIFMSVKPYRLQAQSQAQICRDLLDQIEVKEKRLEKIEALKLNFDAFFNLMDNPASGDGIPEEIATCEHRISFLEQKIAGGDRSAETAAELKNVRTCLELLNLRNDPKNSKTALLKDPRYLEQQRALKDLSSEQTELKMDVAKNGLEMQNNNCPPRTKKTGDDLDDLITTKAENGWGADWKCVNQNEGTTITMKLNGSGTPTSGTTTITNEGMTIEYQLKGCKETSPGKLSCSFTVTLEDYEKYVERKGTVSMTLTDNNTNATNWQESGSPTWRWKPGARQREIIPEAPRSFKIVFKRD